MVLRAIRNAQFYPMDANRLRLGRGGARGREPPIEPPKPSTLAFLEFVLASFGEAIEFFCRIDKYPRASNQKAAIPLPDHPKMECLAQTARIAEGDNSSKP